jgi:uncharacterized membrane protein
MTLFDDIIGIAVIVAFILFVYSGIKKQSMAETIEHIRESFKGETE